MPFSLVIGWFVIGFAVAAVVLYAPMMTRSALQKIHAIRSLQDANRVAKETTAQAREMAEVERTIAEARDGQLDALRKLEMLSQEHNELLRKYMDTLEEYRELLEKHAILQADHKALLWRTGGGVEGTA